MNASFGVGKMRTVAIAMLNSILVLAINLSGAEVRSQTVNDQSSPQSSRPLPKIEVRLSLPKPSIVSGAPVLVQVELRNAGDEPIYVPNMIHLNSWGFPAELEVRLWGPKSNWQGMAGGVDGFIPKHQDFYTLIFKYWVVLAPGYSYGTIVDLTDSAFRGILRPGHYRITAKYSAFGMGDKSMNNPLGAYLDRVPWLPYASWEGMVECKQIWVEITPVPLRTKRSN